MSTLASKERAALTQIAELALERQVDAAGEGAALARLAYKLETLRREFAWAALVETCAGLRPFTITFDQSENCAEAFDGMATLSCCEFEVDDPEDRERIASLLSAAGIAGDDGEWQQEFAVRVDDLMDAHAGTTDLEAREPFVFAPKQQRFVRFFSGGLTPAMWLNEGMTAAEHINTRWNFSDGRPVSLHAVSELIAHSSPDQLSEALEMIDANGIQLEEGVRDIFVASIARDLAGLNQRRSRQRPGM